MKYLDTKVMVENIKDIISEDVQGKVFDHHVADALGMDYGSLRMCKSTNKIPYEEMITFCFAKNVNAYQFFTGAKDSDLLN